MKIPPRPSVSSRATGEGGGVHEAKDLGISRRSSARAGGVWPDGRRRRRCGRGRLHADLGLHLQRLLRDRDRSGERVEGAELPGVARTGPIALQHHGDAVEFGNIWIKELK